MSEIRDTARDPGVPGEPVTGPAAVVAAEAVTVPEPDPVVTEGTMPVAATAATAATEATVASPDPEAIPPGGLARATSRGVLVTLGGQWGRTVVQTVSTVLLARLLVPEDFGLVAMVTAIVGVADLLRDFGLSGAIVQVKKISSELWSSLVWLSLGLGAICMVVVAACAPLIAALYGEPRLTVLVLVLSPGLLINGLCMPLQTKLQRELRFSTLASIDVLSMLFGVTASIAGALLGWGVWSLVLLTGVGVVYRLIALIRVAWPKVGRPRINREVMPFVGTGANIFGVQLLNYAARNIDNIVVGRFGGAALLGLYSRAYNLLLLPLSQLNGPLTRVALPVLSRLQDDHERYRRYVRSALLVIGYLACPVFAVAAGVAVPLVEVLLGDEWSRAGTIFSLLAIAGVAQAFGNIQGWLYISLGRTRKQLVYYVVTRPIVIASFFLGYWWDEVEGLALCYGVVSLLLLWPGFRMAISGTAVTGADVLKPVLRPASLAVPCFLVSWGVAHVVGDIAILQLLAGGLAGVLVLALLCLLPGFRGDVKQILAFVRTVRNPRNG
ncbi:oligosaccharide flippase family protein [Nakamurella sp. YIM 132087]|uniref:Oligosaccharide flippase family protein n=1 Tax=Nakamurella alba TaxID=2665158 RepID=A0A7K1FNU9_9ACTN|nr:lipopolysaccharide biosynthesis protein [Nakamurella alba]MTD15841.1 oligosaccharide flippase family protein [Nakamurella alba]